MCRIEEKVGENDRHVQTLHVRILEVNIPFNLYSRNEDVVCSQVSCHTEHSEDSTKGG